MFRKVSPVTFGLLKKIFLAAVISEGILIPCAMSAVHVYWTRGFDGTGVSQETTTNNIFLENGGSVFTDRLINGANAISDVDKLGVLNPNTGARTDDSVTADYANDGSVYLHVGYINSGFIGSGTELQNINLNGDLVICRMAFENTYSRDGSTLKTANLPTGITAGDSDYTITFNYTGSADIFFFRSGGTDASIYASSFILDCNIFIPTETLTSTGLFSVKTGAHLILGSEDHKRTLTIQAENGTSTVGRVFGISTGADVTSYSDFVISCGAKTVFYLGGSNQNIYSNGSITINDTGTESFYIFDSAASSGTNNNIVSTGDIKINSITSSDFELLKLSSSNSKATFGGDLYINSGVANTGAAYGFRIIGSGNELTVNGDINVSGEYSGSLFRIDARASNSVINMFGDITITNNTTSTTLFSHNSPNSVINFYGDITITANAKSTSILSTDRKSKSVTNFYGKIDTTARTQETSFQSTYLDSIVNFRGSVDNTFHNVGLRKSVYNLLNTNDSAALNVQSSVGLGGKAKLNVFGANQLKVSPNASWNLWTATDGVAGIVNLNGTSLEMGKVSFGGSNSRLVLDFGMQEHGMSEEQLAAQGITSEMINATGSGEDQVISILSFAYNEASTLDTCYVEIRNYIAGEDCVLSYTKLSELTLNGEAVYSDSVLEENILRFDGYIDSEKYGVDYYLAEVETTDAYGAPCWEYYIIPEPADVAALIGAIALGFAFLRRKH